MKTKLNVIALAVSIGFGITACGKPKTSGTAASATSVTDVDTLTGLTASKPSEINARVVSTVSTAAVGTTDAPGLGAGVLRAQLISNHGISSLGRTELQDAEKECNDHGQPLAHEGEPSYSDGILQSDQQDFALRQFYCAMARDSDGPETVQGAINSTNAVLCMFENGAGFQYDGVAREIDLAALLEDAELVAKCGIDIGSKDDGNDPIRMATWTLTATSPAAFNANFDSGVSIKGVIDGSVAMEFSAASRVREGVATILVRSGSEDEKKFDGYLASIDLVKNQLIFDARFDRFQSVYNGVGYSRRTQITAGLKRDGDAVVGIENIDGIISNAYAQDSGLSGEFQTIRGTLTDGLRTHNYMIADLTSDVADLLDPAKYRERTDSIGAKASDECFAKDEAANCAGNDGISLDGVTSLDYLMVTGGNHTPVFTWVGSINEVDASPLTLQE
ncbi:MAG: hypothetical protein AAB425_07930 [Bdellovibrionota bacterium]